MKKLSIWKHFLFLSLFIVCLAVISCSKSGTANNFNCDTTPKSFSVNVNPIIQTYCNQAGCHASGSTNGPGPLTNYSQFYSARNLIRVQIEAGLMPQNATLTTAQKNSILCWIDSGAPDN